LPTNSARFVGEPRHEQARPIEDIAERVRVILPCRHKMSMTKGPGRDLRSRVQFPPPPLFLNMRLQPTEGVRTRLNPVIAKGLRRTRTGPIYARVRQQTSVRVPCALPKALPVRKRLTRTWPSSRPPGPSCPGPFAPASWRWSGLRQSDRGQKPVHDWTGSTARTPTAMMPARQPTCRYDADLLDHDLVVVDELIDHHTYIPGTAPVGALSRNRHNVVFVTSAAHSRRTNVERSSKTNRGPSVDQPRHQSNPPACLTSRFSRRAPTWAPGGREGSPHAGPEARGQPEAPNTSGGIGAPVQSRLSIRRSRHQPRAELPEVVRAGIVAMVKAASEGDGWVTVGTFLGSAS
jgi:hypothetical protein